MPRTSSRNSPGRRNLLAGLITAVSVGVLYTSFDPVPAGEESFTRKSAPVVPGFDEEPVPRPPEADLNAADLTQVLKPVEEVKDNSDAGVLKKALAGKKLDNLESLRFCQILLKDGERFINNFDTYSVTFHREERIDGDMKVPQSIDMKVRQSPHFAVYMKWLSGEKGQQVLYSDEYEDRCMVVKFGGFKRLLPGIKLDPKSSLAMAETRYPVTEAGLGGMIRQLLKHRNADVKRNKGAKCVRMADKEFDGKMCHCFLVEYDSPEISKVYRKSLLMIDTECHLPIMVRNYTWSSDSSLQGKELDEVSMIEDYAFTDLRVDSTLVAQDFSRDNPLYRM